MKSFKEFRNSGDQSKSDSERSETVEELEEGTLRNLGAGILFARVVSRSKQIKRSKSAEEKLDLISDQNVSLAGLVMAVGKFLEKQG